MMERAARRLGWALLGVLPLLGACASSRGDRDPAPLTDPLQSFAPASPCGPGLAKPQIVATQPAQFPSSVWERKSAFQARLRFRIDADGVPQPVRTTVDDQSDDHDALVAAATAALAGYRFCAATSDPGRTEWSASMLFRYQRVGAEFGNGEMYIQQFVPAYSRAEVQDGRAGRVRVRGTFAPDGRPTSVAVSSSSGDGVLDRKSLEAMASHQLVFRPGTVLTRPIVFEQPYQYEIR